MGIRRLPPRRGLLSEFLSLFKALSTYSEVFLCYIDIWFLTYGIRAQGLGVSLLHLRHRGIFAIIFFYNDSEGMNWRIFSRRIKVCWVKNSSPEALYFQRYNLCKIGFWNNPELSKCKIFAIYIYIFCNVSDPEL